MPLQPEQIERIISAVGDRYRGNPHRDALHSELEAVIDLWQLFLSGDSDDEAREKHELFTTITQHASKLREALSKRDGWPAYYLHGTTRAQSKVQFETAGAEADRFLVHLSRIVTDAEVATETFGHGAVMRLERSPNNWLAGDALPRVFENNFPRRAGVSRPSDLNEGKKIAGGPFIRFAVAVFREVGIKISPDTVARALNDVRKKRTRRKPKSPRAI